MISSTNPSILFRCSFIAGGLISFATVGIAAAQSLGEALIQTHEVNPDLLVARAQAVQAVETYNDAVAQTRLRVDGSLSGNASTNNAVSSSNPDGDSQSDETSEVSLSFSQHLFQGSFDGIPAGVRVALGDVSAAHATYLAAEIDTLTSAVAAYMDVVRDEGALAVALSGVNTAEQELEAAQARLNAGEGTRTDLALAQSGLAQAQTIATLARATLSGTRATFVRVIGQSPEQLRDPGFPSMPATLDAALQTALSDHPLIKAAEINLSIARDRVITTRAQYGVNVLAQGSLSRSWDGIGSGDDTDASSIGFTASLPLYTSGQREAALASVEQGVLIAEANLTGQKAAIEARVRAAWANADAQFENLNRRVTITKAQELVLRATEAEFDAGTATFLAVQNAQQDYLEAQDQYVSDKSNAVTAAYNLLAATGEMTTEALDLPVLHFDTLAVLDENRVRSYPQLLFGVK